MLFLYGSPGVGKTALAQELAHELRTAYPDGQLYVNLEWQAVGEPRVTSFACSCARRLARGRVARGGKAG